MSLCLGAIAPAIAISFCASAAADEPAVPPEAAAQSQTHNWEFGIGIRAVGGPCAGLMGTFPVPTEWPEQQVKVINEQVTPSVQRHSYRVQEGLKQTVFQVPQLPAGGTAECYITFEITKTAQRPPANKFTLVIPKDPPREVRKYLAPSPLIESTGAKIRTLSRDLTAGKEMPWEQVEAILAGVRENVKFEPDTKDVFKGALAALRDGQADREDMTATFVAICRAVKIPARMVWAMDYCYAEFYLEEPPDDAAKASAKKAPPPGAWYPCVVHEQVELGTVTDFRPIMEKGDNFKVPEEKAAQRFVKEFLTGKGGTGGKPSVEFRRRNAD
jgi:hypothetical protein